MLTQRTISTQYGWIHSPSWGKLPTASDDFGALATIEKLDLIMPRYAIRGGDVVLKCDHSVSPEQLYKVEWQKGGNKIFQYIKGRTPPFRHFPSVMTGAVLNRANSSEKQLQLSNLDFSASGSYSCVVSMETPIFSKDSESHVLTVIGNGML
ncbi:Immunoglobulin V-set domain [Popillia japonica]|uniref:Immunoglobulin V-set domain n=1 Tax=Popillia japonica TaxID=7064 RepID=A0AAW1M198_POPJA